MSKEKTRNGFPSKADFCRVAAVECGILLMVG